MVINRSFWRKRRVVLTGHTGFKGTWLALLLRELGAEVTGVALTPEAHSLFELAKISDGIDDRRTDIRNPDALRDIVTDAKPEIVFHLAAQSLVRNSYLNPAETFSTNVIGTMNVLNVLRPSTDLKAAIVITSDKVYHNKEWDWAYRETDGLGGHDPYSASKAAAEIVTASMASSFFSEGAAVVTARAGNVIGGGDFAVHRLVPDVFRSLQQNSPVVLRNPSSIRPWQHVIDPLVGYIALAEAAAHDPSIPNAFNFGPSIDDAMTVEAVVHHFLEAFGRSANIEIDATTTHHHEAKLLRVDASRARSVLGWRPLLTTQEAIASTAKWYRAAMDGEDMAALTRSEARELLKRAEVS